MEDDGATTRSTGGSTTSGWCSPPASRSGSRSWRCSTTLALAAVAPPPSLGRRGFAAAPVLALAGVGRGTCCRWRPPPGRCGRSPATGRRWPGRWWASAPPPGCGRCCCWRRPSWSLHRRGRAVELLPAAVTAVGRLGAGQRPGVPQRTGRVGGLLGQAADRGPEPGSLWTVLDEPRPASATGRRSWARGRWCWCGPPRSWCCVGWAPGDPAVEPGRVPARGRRRRARRHLPPGAGAVAAAAGGAGPAALARPARVAGRRGALVRDGLVAAAAASSSRAAAATPASTSRSWSGWSARCGWWRWSAGRAVGRHDPAGDREPVR